MSLERKLARGFVKGLGQMERERQRQANARAKEQARQAREHQKRLKAYERERTQAEKQAEREAIMATTAAAMQRAADQNSYLEKYLTDLEEILWSTLQVDDYFDLKNLKKTRESDPYVNSELQTPLFKPVRGDYPEQPEEYMAPTIKMAFLKRKKTKDAIIQKAKKEFEDDFSDWQIACQRIDSEYEKELKAYKSREATRIAKLSDAIAEHEKNQKEHNDQLKEHNDQIDQFISYLAYGDKGAIEDYLSIVFERSIYPVGFHNRYQCDFKPETAELIVRVEIPGPNIIPAEKQYKYIKSRDEITKSKRSKTDIKKRYTSIVNQVALRTAHEVFESDRAGLIKTISLQVGTIDSSPATGKTEFLKFAILATTREEFEELNLSAVNFDAAMTHLGASVSKNPSELVEAKPMGIKKR